MTDPSTDRTIARETIHEAVRTVARDWRVLRADPATAGFMPVYHLAVETPSGSRECYLKATPREGGGGVGLEARLLSILGAHTSVPVPEVYGAVDEGEDLPAPLFLMESVPGETVARPDQPEVPPEIQEGIARSLGRHLADLHGLDVLDGFGYLGVADDRALRGERPPADPGSVEVRDPTDAWPDRLRTDAGAELDSAADTEFAGAVADVAPILHDRIDDLTGPFRPALCHVDHSIENLAFEAGSGEVTGVFDWAFAVAAPPDYDLLYAERSLAGGPLLLLPDVPAHRDRIREALLAGYREGGSGDEGVDPEATIDRFRANRETYRLLALVRMANLFEGWFDLKGIEGSRREAAVRELRCALEAFA